jgi:hypothetical protein
MLTKGSRGTARWLAILWPLGIAAQLAVLILLFDGGEEVTAVVVVNRLVGGFRLLRPDRVAAPAR